MNCKPGDLAVVIRSQAGNEGKIVRVVKYDPMHMDWRVECESGMLKACLWDGTPSGLSSFGYFPDAWLMPISGLPETEDTDEREPIKEVA